MSYTFFLPGMLLCCSVTFGQTTSPSVVASAGNSTQNGTVRLDQTIGEPLTQTYTNGSSGLTQGFHQPVVSAVGIAEWNAASVQLFPNPGTDFVNVVLPSGKYETYRIIDAAGRLVAEDRILTENIQLTITNWSTGVYTILLKGTLETSLSFIKN